MIRLRDPFRVERGTLRTSATLNPCLERCDQHSSSARAVIAERTDPVSQIATHRTRQKTLARGTSLRASTGEDGGEGDSPGREEHVERMKGPSTRCRSVRFRARAALHFETETLPPPDRRTRHAGRDSGSEDGAALRYAHLAVSSPQSRRSECRPPRPPSARASARGHRGAPRRR